MKISKKIVLLGHFGVGKSSLIRRFVENTFSEDYKVTIGVHIFKKNVSIPEKGTDVSLVLWDLEGNDDISNTRLSYLIGTHAFIYVYDVSRPATYKNLESELEFLKEKQKNTPITVVGNKEDLVTKTYLKQNVDDFGSLTDLYVSAKTGHKVDFLFSKLAEALI
ncbi:small GTP-binding protein [Lacinutrix venerupis]|uniref:GTP-binding protein n=1 Tax=Lacinutrix venerupis TaxID=1486034 RepID=A0AAC9LKS2_9FLAO|nr:Rab family GTPase [Lacinutrix venerupis]APX99186.1 GTP-binding protein [Lacinutrix venerupis]RLJ65559.1 small GTP-binding protein [Lacinutrix venerupis]